MMWNWLQDGKKMTAERREEALSAYIDGELSERERADLEGALARDPALRAELEELRQVVGMMRAVPQVPLPRSFTLDPAVYGRPERSWFQLYPVLRTAAVLATLVFVFMFAGVQLANIGGRSGLPAAEPELAAMRAAETTVVERQVVEPQEVEVTREVEAPSAKVATDSASEEMLGAAPVPTGQEEAPTPAPEAESQGEGVARVTGTEAVAAEPVEPVESPDATPVESPAPAAIAAETVEEQTEAPAEEPTGEVPSAMVAPLPVEGGGELESSAPAAGTATPAAEATVMAYGLEAPQAAPEATEGEVAPRGTEGISEGPNWVLIAEIGLGALAAILLVLTLLARHYSW